MRSLEHHSADVCLPIAYDKSLETPLVPQVILQQEAGRASWRAVHRVVRAHDRADAAFHDARFEHGQVRLLQVDLRHLLVTLRLTVGRPPADIAPSDDGVEAFPPVFLVVDREVFHSGGQLRIRRTVVSTLHRPNVMNSIARRQERILPWRFLPATPAAELAVVVDTSGTAATSTIGGHERG